MLTESAQWRLQGGAGIDNECLMNLLAEQGVLQGTPASRLDPALGRCHFFENIMQAAKDLLIGDAPLAIVGCVDSLCDDPILQAFADADVLKSSTNPEGFVAGEAAGVFVLERESDARRRNRLAFAYIAATGRGLEPCDLSKPVRSNAMGLRNAFTEAFADLPLNGGEVEVVIADLNGERARAKEWAITAPRIFPRDDKRRELKHPADCTGDCSAAMGTILLATAVDLLARASEPVWGAATTSDSGGARRVICLEKGDVSGIYPCVQSENISRNGVVIGVLQQHFLDASFLWLTPHSSVDQLELERREKKMEWNLAGLLHGGEAVWKLCEESLSYRDPGDFFVAAAVAFGTANQDRVEILREEAGSNEALMAAITAGTDWASHYRHM